MSLNPNQKGKSDQKFEGLLDRVATGESEAEQKLYDLFSHRVIHLAASRISEVFNSKISPEDVVQSVFKSFFVRFRKQELSFQSWDEIWSFLMCVTVRKCSEQANWFLREKRDVNREFSSSQVDPRQSDNPFSIACSSPTPQQVAIFEDLLGELMAPLSDEQREVVRLRMEGFTNNEIAKKLNRAERTVYRTLEQLREQIRNMEKRYLLH